MASNEKIIEAIIKDAQENEKEHIENLRQKMSDAGVSPNLVGKAAPDVPDYPPCDFCGKEFSGKLICGSCKCVSYCSRDCQKMHWKKHKEECANMDQQCETAAKLFVDTISDKDCPMPKRLDHSLWESLDESSPYKKAIEKGLNGAIQNLLEEERDNAEELISSGILASYTQMLMCTLFRNGRHIPGGVFSGVDAYRIKQYVHSSSNAFEIWFETSLKIISIFAETATLGSNQYFWRFQKMARDIAAAWGMVFTSPKASKAILLGTSKEVDDAARARVKWITTQLKPVFPLFPQESPDNSAVEGQFNQFAAMIDLRCESYGMELDFVKLLGLKGVRKSMYNSMAIPFAEATMAKGKSLTTAESQEALMQYARCSSRRTSSGKTAGNNKKKKGKKNRM